MKINEAIQEYLTECEIRKYTPRTLRSYRLNLNLFCRWCDEEKSITDMDEIKMPIIRQFTQFMIQKGRKGTYINGLLKTIKSFLTYIWDEYGEGFNTKKGNFKWCKEEKPVIRAFKPSDVKKMLDSCKGTDYLSVRDYCILTVFFEAGIRCLELCSIKPEDIHSDFIIIKGKNHKQRVVPITPVMRKAMYRYERCRDSYFVFKPVDDYYFLSFRGKMLTNSAVEHIFKQRGEGIKNVRVSPHTARHFFAQQQVKMGTDLYTISRLLGHENIQITQIYLDSLRDEDIIKIAKQKSVLMNM